MPRPRSIRALAMCALALAAGGSLSACGKERKPGEKVREGLTTSLGGLDYVVYITRQLNLRLPEDRGYYQGEEAAPGHGLYGVFLSACNKGKQPATASSTFEIHDTQGEVFKPRSFDPKNPFMWHGGKVPPNNCEPPRGSLAELSPASGAIVLFDLPLAATENRPLELHIQGPFDPATGKNTEAVVELDI